MKARNAARLSALRMLKAAVMNKGVEKGRDLDDAEILQVVASLVKQRRDSIEQFEKAGRTDLVEKETHELAVLQEYLPPAATPEEIDGRGGRGDRRNGRLLAQGHGEGDEGRDAEARRQECRRARGERRRSSNAWRLTRPRRPPP